MVKCIKETDLTVKCIKQTPVGGDGMDIAFETLQLADQTRVKLTQVHDVLSKDRGHLLEIILATSKG